MLLSSSADFFKMNFFKEFFQEHYQTVKLFRSRAVLSWVELVCKGCVLLCMTREGSGSYISMTPRIAQDQMNIHEKKMCNKLLRV